MRPATPLRPGRVEAPRDALDALADFGELRRPDECDQPILTRDTRAVVHQWLYELNHADALSAVGIKPRQRALLKGPPGTGKTTLAWHIAARLGLPLLVVETPSVVSRYVGATGENLGKLFALARDRAGEVALFFDEIDALATSRSGGETSAGREQNAQVVALLQMLDRHDGLVFAATNRPDNIDAAIWRRFQMQIEVGLPEAPERFAIVKRYLAPFDLADEGLQVIAECLAGAAPALIREVMETVKRDLVLGPKLGHPLDAAAVFARIRASCAAAEDMPEPPLWSEQAAAMDLLRAAPWPPERAAA